MPAEYWPQASDRLDFGIVLWSRSGPLVGYAGLPT